MSCVKKYKLIVIQLILSYNNAMSIYYDTNWSVIIFNQIIYEKFNSRIIVYLI